MSIDLASLLWPASRLGEAVQHLTGVASLVNPPASIQDDSEALADWLETAALTIGLEAQPLESSFADFERLLRSLGPALLRVPGTDGPKYLAIVKGSTVLTPALDRVRISPGLIRSALCGEREAPAIRQINETLERAQVARAKQAAAREAILRERFSTMRVRGLWQLRLPPGANFWQQLRQERIPGRLAALTGAHAIQYVLWIAAWYVVGTNVLNGRTGRGWLVPWTLLLLALVPLRVLITWLQGTDRHRCGRSSEAAAFLRSAAAGTGQFSSSGRRPITRARAGMRSSGIAGIERRVSGDRSADRNRHCHVCARGRGGRRFAIGAPCRMAARGRCDCVALLPAQPRLDRCAAPDDARTGGEHGGIPHAAGAAPAGSMAQGRRGSAETVCPGVQRPWIIPRPPSLRSSREAGWCWDYLGFCPY